MIKVNRYTRAAKTGKEIYCPFCNSHVIVYHFAWAATVCLECKEEVKKYDWNYAPENSDRA